MWKFTRIVVNEESLIDSNPNYKVSWYSVLVEWETGKTFTEPLYITAVDYNFTCDMYAD